MNAIAIVDAASPPISRDQALARAVPAAARRVLIVGPDPDQLINHLAAARLDLELFAAPSNDQPDDLLPRAARVHPHRDAQAVAIDPGSIDCLLIREPLGQADDPEGLPRRFRPLLAADGVLVGAVANLQHHARLAALLSGDLPPDGSFGQSFSIPGMLKLLLDAGFAPEIAGVVESAAPLPLIAAVGPLLDHLGLHRGRTADRLNVAEVLLCGTPITDADDDAASVEPLSIVVCVTDESILRANLLASPDLCGDSPHEVLAFHGCPDAASGLHMGLARARHRLVVWAHQDVYLPRGSTGRLARRYCEAEQRWGPIGVAGVYGVAREHDGTSRRVGRVVDRDRLLAERMPLPAEAISLDELLLVLPRDTPLRAEPRLGYHLYATDLCLAAHDAGLPAVVLNALCLHNSRHVELPAQRPDARGKMAQPHADRHALRDDRLPRPAWPLLTNSRTLELRIGHGNSELATHQIQELRIGHASNSGMLG